MQQKINCVIIDDEPGNIITLEELLKLYCPQVKVTGKAANAITGFECITKQKPDLVFLDIEMPYGNGFDLLDKLAPVQFEVIFITAFDNYAIQAFKYAALDYILKPVSIDELKKGVLKTQEIINTKAENLRVKTLLSNLKNNSSTHSKISLPSEKGYIFEEIQNIIYLEAKGSYTFIFTADGKKYTVSKSLKEFEEILPDNIFCRVHHSYIINITGIKKYNKGRGGMVEMENGVCIDVAVRKKEQFLEKIKASK